MRNILFDFTFYQVGTTFHGGGEYGNVVLEELLKQSEQINCGIFFYKARKIDGFMLRKCQKFGWNLHAISDFRSLASVIKEYHYTTIYSALPYIGGWRKINFPEGIRFIGTFHGLRNIELADCRVEELSFYEQKSISDKLCYIYGVEDDEQRSENRLKYEDAISVFKNGKIIAVSEHTKHSMCYYYPELQKVDIEVLYSPPKLENSVEVYKDEEILAENKLLTRNFGLIVSAGIWYKNGRRALLAYDKLFDRQYAFIRPDYKVVVLGVKKQSELLNGIVHQERFLLLDYVPSDTLEVFYRNAQLFVYPSLNEGFGYPPLEAMKYGTLCACSANTSIAEICKDMVLYFNPLLIEEMAIRILESFSDKIRAEKEEKMRQQMPTIINRQKEDLQKLVKIIIGEV